MNMNKRYLMDKPIGHVACTKSSYISYTDLNRRAEKMNRNRFINSCNKNKNIVTTIFFSALVFVAIIAFILYFPPK